MSKTSITMNPVTIWTTLGDSVGGEWRWDVVLIHTEDPGLVMQEGKYGKLVKVKVDNMFNTKRWKEERQAKPVEEKNMPSFGSCRWRIGWYLKRKGVDYIISGGQTMNPSTEDFVKAVEELNARNIIIFKPNNKNILMAAQSAAEVIDQPAAVVETKIIPQD